MKTNFWKILTCACVALGATACSDIDDLRRDVDDLEHRVIALETQIQQLNNNVEALQILLNGTTVNSVTVVDGVYTVTLSNGDVLTLTQGSEGGYIVPKVAIDEEGYWIISVNDGAFERMKDADGHDVLAVAQDGKPGNDGHDGTTPQFCVDAENYWQVSYDGGATWNYVMNGNQKVKADTATGTQDPFFADVKVDGDKLVLTLLDGGTAYEIPIYAGFKCIISGAASGTEVEFDYNATKTFDVDMEGVATTIVTAPAGWEADLTAKTGGGTPAYVLTVAAPTADAAKSRATADSRIDVSILAVASNGLSTIAKLRVKLTGMVLSNPTVKSVTVDADKTTETALTFSVVTDDADGWKYICQPSASAAPDAAKVMADGTAGKEGANTVSGLTKNTAYTIYVVAYNGDTLSPLETKEVRTLKGVTDYYEEGVTLGGVTYDKNTSGAQLITAATTISANGVYFIDTEDEITLNKLTTTELILIGRHSNKYPKVKIADNNTIISMNTGTGFILKNIEFDASPRNNYVLNFNGGTVTCENLIFDNCKIITPENNHCSYFNNANAKINRVEIVDCSVHCNATADDKAMRIINLNQGAIGQTAKFQNNIVYSKYLVRGCLLHVQAAATDMSAVDIDVTNCSFVNYVGNPNGYLNLSNIHDVKFAKNIMWANTSTGTTSASYVLKFIATENQVRGTLNYQDNLAYGFVDNNTGCWKYFATDGKYLPDEGNYKKEDTDPFKSMDFDTGKFVPADASYGASIE